jgi:hypothetical protein
MSSAPILEPMAGEKIIELLSEYDLGDYGEKLEQKWTRSDPESRKSTRELAVELNTEIISQFIKERADGVIPIDTSPEKIQTILRDISTNETDRAAATSAERLEFERWLQEQGINPEELREDLVSHVSMHAYLTDQRGATRTEEKGSDRSPGQHQESKIETLSDMQYTFSGYVDDQLEPLRNRSLLPDVDPLIETEFRITCPECWTEHTPEEYIRNQGCTECDAHE